MPASVQKLYTSVAALRRLGRAGGSSTGVLAATPPDARGRSATATSTCAAAAIPRSTRSTRGAWRSRSPTRGSSQVTGRVRGDESAFDARRGVPSSGFRLTSRGRAALGADLQPRPLRAALAVLAARPARFAAAAFSKQLRHLGVACGRAASTGVAPADAALVTEWRSAPVADLVRLMNPPSDNFMAETLVKVLGARFGTSGSTAGHARRARRSWASSESRRR